MSTDNSFTSSKIDITVAMPEKMVYNNQRIMPHLKSTFPGWIQRANPKHPNAEA